MAYDTTELKCKFAGMTRQFYNEWIYDTTDAVSTVRGANYITDAQAKGFNVGDVVYVRVWSTSVRSGTLSAFSICTVLSVASTGADLSDGTALTLTNT